MPSEPIWTTSEDVVEVNRLVLLGTDEPHILVSMAHLIGACQRPNNHWHYDGIEDIVSLSVVLLFGIAKNHPFIQGNKRTGFAAMVMFLQDNGYELSVSDDVRLADDIIKVIEGKMSEGEFEHKLRRVVTVIDERTW